MNTGLSASSLCHNISIRDHCQFQAYSVTMLPFSCILLFFLQLILDSRFAYIYVYLFILKCDLPVSCSPLDLPPGVLHFLLEFRPGPFQDCCIYHLRFSLLLFMLVSLFSEHMAFLFSFNSILLLKHIFEWIPKKEYMGCKIFESA